MLFLKQKLLALFDNDLKFCPELRSSLPVLLNLKRLTVFAVTYNELLYGNVTIQFCREQKTCKFGTLLLLVYIHKCNRQFLLTSLGLRCLLFLHNFWKLTYCWVLFFFTSVCSLQCNSELTQTTSYYFLKKD